MELVWLTFTLDFLDLGVLVMVSSDGGIFSLGRSQPQWVSDPGRLYLLYCQMGNRQTDGCVWSEGCDKG